MDIKKNLVKAHHALQNSSPTPNLDCEVLLSFVLKKPREWILAWPEEKISNTDKQKFLELINKRLLGEPVAYLVGRKEFFGLDFLVDKRVPIPRPETELLVEEVLCFTRGRDVDVSPSGGSRIIEIGTGSGCIAISLAKNLPQAQIIATDISKDALDVAKKNARKHSVDKQITFLQKNLLHDEGETSTSRPRREYGNAPILVANLPYLPKAIYQTADKSVHAEPAQAHLGGKKGFEIIEKFLKQARALKPQAIFLEFHYGYKNELRKIIKKYFSDYNIEFKKDLAGKDRFALAIAKTNKKIA